MNTIADRLAYALDAGKLTIADVIKRGGPSRPTLYRIQNDLTYQPEDYTVSRLAKALDVSSEWLATGEGQPWFKGMAAEPAAPYRADQLNAEVLAQALALVLQELQNRKATLPPSKIAAAVVEIYELVTSQGKKEVALDNVTPFVRLLLAR